MTTIDLEKYDDCCYKVIIKKDDVEVETGIWCPKTHIVSINGEIAGFCSTKEDVINNIKLVQVPGYRVV